MTTDRLSFASDNFAGAHPAVMRAVHDVAAGTYPAYGDDRITDDLQNVVRVLFGENARIFPVFNGTGANVVALQALTERWEAVICAESAHIHEDEGGAPEHVGGLKLWTVPTTAGKLTISDIETQAHGYGFVHRAQPRVISLTQATEYGTTYRIDELQELTEWAHNRNLRVHMDGARLANAAVSQRTTLAQMTAEVGIDALSLGGTKNGAMMAEAVIVWDDQLADRVNYLRKTSMQLASKMRFLSAQFLGLFTDELWRTNAQHANDAAQLLAEGLRKIPGCHISQPVQANAVFAFVPRTVAQVAATRVQFYVWDERPDHAADMVEIRLMCAWDTSKSDITRCVAVFRDAMET